MITAKQIRQKYLKFFEDRGHKIIPSAPLIPENDSTTLFTSSGMQPLIPYLLGQPHPEGQRLTNSQKCFRSQDIDEVGDNRHTTFFEMLGNWSLGDYFKTEQLTWLFEFLTQELCLPVDKLAISVFKGNPEIPRDEEAATLWQKLGIPKSRIFHYDVSGNWWARTDYSQMPVGEPGGPSSEVFYEFTHISHDLKYGNTCHPNCNCGRFMEIGNSVFMTYKKTATGFAELHQKNIDFGGGLERLAAACNNDPDIFNTDLFAGAKQLLEDNTLEENKRSLRVVLDHFRASVFIIDSGIEPSNKERGYVLRRLIRRMAAHCEILHIDLLDGLSSELLDKFVQVYPEVSNSKGKISEVIETELVKFRKTLKEGLEKIGKVSSFDLWQTYGFPEEIIREILKEKGVFFDEEEFKKEKQKHQDLSRTASVGMFKGGLADQSETTTKYHTATHLLHAALHDILGLHVQQKGSNITSERLRFDFSHPEKLTSQQISQIEKLVNQKIDENIPVTKEEKNKQQALQEGALAFFPEKYPDVTNVYSIGNFSKEICGGPHVASTGEIGKIKIIKEESVSSGVRRIYATALSQKI